MAIFTAIGTAIAGSAALFGGIITAGQLLGSALAFAANIGLQYLRRPKARKYAAIQGETQYGGDVPVGTLYGVGSTKGQRVFYAKYDSGNKLNSEVFVLANGWCDGLEPYVYIYGRRRNLILHSFPGNHVAAYYVEGFTNHIRILFFDGRPGQQVDTNLVAATAGLGQTWKSTSVNAGQAYVVVNREFNADLFSAGKPEFTFVLRGLREYDPRKDSTISGGSGAQRINDPSTWVHTSNPAVHRLNYQLGLRAYISGRTLIGEGKTLGQLDLATYFVAMNVCDSLRADGKRTYQCSLFVNGDDDHTEILKEFDDAMAGYGLNRRGLSGVIAGAPQLPVLEITADDIPVDRAKDIQFRKSAFERYNYLSGQFLSIEAMWSPESLTPVTVNADVAEDGRAKQTSNDFLQVTDPDIAQYLLNIRYRQNRMGGTATLPVSRRVGFKVQEGEWVTWRGRTWMISEWALDEQFRITLKLSETDAAIYDDDDIEPGPVVIPPTPPINPSLLSTVQDFDADAGFITGLAGYDVPTLKFTWTPPSDPTITNVRFFYKVEGSSEVFQDQSPDPDAGEYTTTKNVVSGKIYLAQATITTVPDRFKTLTPWVTTDGPTGLMSMLNDLAHVGQDVRDRLTELQTDMDRELRPIIADLLEAFSLEGAVGEIRRQEMTAQIGSSLSQIIEERRVRATADDALAQILTSLSSSVGANLARLITEETTRATATEALAQQIVQLTAETAEAITAAVQTEQTARTDADEALAESIVTVQAAADDAMAAVQTEQTARADADSAIAESVTQVQAQVDDVSADGYLAITAQTSGGTLSKIELAARATLGDTAALAAFIMEVINDGGVLKTRTILYADRTIFVAPDGSDGTSVIEFDADGARLNVPVSGTLIDVETISAERIILNGVTTDRIFPNAVTDSAVFATSGVNFTGQGYNNYNANLGSIVVTHPEGATLTFWCFYNSNYQQGIEGASYPNLRMRNVTNNVVVGIRNGASVSFPVRLVTPAGQTSTTFQFQASGGSLVPSNVSGVEILCVTFKR
jgi:hypothetical protein